MPDKKPTPSTPLSRIKSLSKSYCDFAASQGVKTVGDLLGLKREDILKLPIDVSQKAELHNFADQLRQEVEGSPIAHSAPGLDHECVLHFIYSLIEYRTVIADNPAGEQTPLNAIMLAMIDLIVAIYDSYSFFEGRAQIDWHKRPSELLGGENGIVAMLKNAEGNPLSLVQQPMSRKLATARIELFGQICGLLEIFLNDLTLSPETAEEVAEYGGYCGLTDFSDQILQLSLNPDDDELREDASEEIMHFRMVLVGIHLRLMMREHEIFDAHPDWVIELNMGASIGEMNYAETRRNHSQALHDYFKRYPCPFDTTESVSRDLEEVEHDKPIAFSSSLDNFAQQLQTVLTMPPTVSFQDPVQEQVYGEFLPCTVPVSIWLLQSRSNCLNLLHSYYLKRAQTSAGEIRKLWIEADAELMRHHVTENCQPVLNSDDAQKVIAAADYAARETWVGKRVKSLNRDIDNQPFPDTCPQSPTGNPTPREEIHTIASTLKNIEALMLEDQQANNAHEDNTYKGFSKSSHRGELYLGVKIEQDGRHLTINGTQMCFRGETIWRIVDRLVEAYFNNEWADFTSSDWACLTSANGKQLRQFIERKPIETRRRGNERYEPKAKLKVN